MSVFDHPEFDQHESIHYVHDASTGLRAIICIHSTALGPAAGGCRHWQYASDETALTDVLRLARGMTYKNAIAGLRFGGGKSVILANDATPKTAELMHAFGRAVESLGGRYVTAEDVGCSVDDMRNVNQETRYVSGLPKSGDNAGGDPSPMTALGVFLGIQAAVKARLGSDSLQGINVAVQGVGKVGLNLCRLLNDAGAGLTVADVNDDHLQQARDELPVTEVAPTEILFSDVDVLAPCALGSILTAQTIPNIKAKIIAGAANNQLSTEEDGARLAEREILYAPDYVINAGGICSVYGELEGWTAEQSMEKAGGIYECLLQVFGHALIEDIPTSQAADSMARRRIAEARRLRET